jgi:hypothetical protein
MIDDRVACGHSMVGTVGRKLSVRIANLVESGSTCTTRVLIRLCARVADGKDVGPPP